MPFPSLPRTRMRGIKFAGFMLLAATGTALHSQNASPVVDGFNPNPNGIVNSIVLQPDGKILMGGYFTQVQPEGNPLVGRSYIARLNHDGSVDTSFSPSANGVVRAIALQPNGQIIVGGEFTTFQGTGSSTQVTSNYIARLNADGTLDPTFNLNANGVVYAIAVEPNGPPAHDVELKGPPDWFIDNPHLKPYGLVDVPLTYDPPVSDAAPLNFVREDAPEKPDYVRCWAQPEPARKLVNLENIPVLVVTSEASYHAPYDHCTVRYLAQAGVKSTHVRLPDIGIHGNGHMMMLEKNSDQIATFLETWFTNHGM